MFSFFIAGDRNSTFDPSPYIKEKERKKKEAVLKKVSFIINMKNKLHQKLQQNYAPISIFPQSGAALGGAAKNPKPGN